MSNFKIQHNMVCMTEEEFRRLMADKEIDKNSAILSGQKVKEVEQRVKLLESQLQLTESELKELKAQIAADELTAESQRLGEYK